MGLIGNQKNAIVDAWLQQRIGKKSIFPGGFRASFPANLGGGHPHCLQVINNNGGIHHAADKNIRTLVILPVLSCDQRSVSQAIGPSP
jgi:hypothetical protein